MFRNFILFSRLILKKSKKVSSVLKIIKKSGLAEYLKSPKGRFFCLIVLALSAWGVFSVLPFNKTQNNIFAKAYNNFSNIEPGAQAAPSLIIGGNSIVNAVPSPVFISSQNLGGLLVDDSGSEDSRSIIKYIVEKGETLSEIADKFNISIDTILLTNELTSSRIVPGQELMILPVNGVMHMVEKGETIKSLALTYKADEQEIIRFNDLSEKGEIYVGDILIIPGGKMPAKQITKPAVKDVSGAGASTQVSLSDSYFIVPAVGTISQGAHFSYVSNGKSYYNSIDISNVIGTPILAAAGGTVQIIKNVWPYGNYITIAHPNGVITLYAHLSSFAKGLTIGSTVTQGQIIGYMGNTGRVISLGGNGSHLHFDVRGAANPLTKYRVGTKVSY